MKSHLFVSLLLFPILLKSQTDTTRNLPTVEISSARLNRFAVGQTRIDMDSAAKSAFQFQNLNEILQFSTPLSIKAYGATLATASTRGTGSSHTAVLWNGLNVQNALVGLADLSAIESGAVERIGLKTGGGSALFGAGAMGGVVYLDNAIEQKTGFHGSVGATVGSFGFLGQNVKLSIGNGHSAGQIRVSHQAALNDFRFRNTADFGQPIQRAPNAAFDRTTATNTLFFDLGKNRFLKLNNWFSTIYRQIPPTMTERNNMAKQNEQAFRSVAEFSTPLSKSGESRQSTGDRRQLFSNCRLSPVDYCLLKMRLGYFDERLLYNSDIVNNSQNNLKTLIGEVETNFDFRKNKTDFNSRIGLNFTQNKSQSVNFKEQKQRDRLALFASQIIDYQKVKLALNVRQELVDSRLVPFTFSVGFEKNLNQKQSNRQSLITNHQSLIANHQSPIINHHFLLRGSFSRNYNLPALNDLYWTQGAQGNPNLSAERGFSGDLGIDFLSKTNQSNSKLSLTTYAMLTDNWILWQPQSNGIWQPSNIAKVIGRGIETAANHNFQVNKWSFFTHATYQLSRSTTDNLRGEQLIYTPIHTASGRIGIGFKQIRLDYFQTFSSRRRMADGFTKPFFVGNLSANSRINLGKTQLSANFRVLNIWNADYQVIRFYAQPRRSWQVDLSWLF